MYRKDDLLLKEAYQKIKESYSQLCLEGAAEDMVTSRLTKLQAPNDIIQFFLQKEAGKLIFKPEHVSTLYSWLKDKNADQRTLIDDYKAYQRFFQTKPLDQFSSYIDWAEKVHAKRDKSDYQSRHKELKEIDISNEDKENVLADDADVLILKGDDEHKCVRYGKGYSFCISRPGGGNMYGAYRLTKSSTFYFIYFKKVPKTDERHIMVLDRTEEGWEWTFGKNQTKAVKGGWDEIITQFPVLAKYKDKFINKPLTDEEHQYQRKLSAFVSQPTLEKFKEFSYKEKADVLKFGMLLPLDLFESLDEDLRNEWITVGPKMSDDIYNLLNVKEKERFLIVRKQQLTLREPEDKWDKELCEGDPELYKIHIKPIEQLEKRIRSKIVNGVYKGNIKIKSTYFFPNLDDLKECGDIHAEKFTGNISLPQLQRSGIINAPNAQSVDLSQLREASGSIIAISVAGLSLPQLQKSASIYAYAATNLSLPQLREGKEIYANKCNSVSLPQLQKCQSISADSATSLSLPRLQQCLVVMANTCSSLSLPQLQKGGSIRAYSATSLSLPKLQEFILIYADSAEKIIINPKVKYELINAKNSVKIIDPSKLKDSIEPQEIKAESFKGVFNRLLNEYRLE